MFSRTAKVVLQVTAVLATAVAFASPVLAQQRLSLAERVQRLEDQSSGRGQGQNSVDQVNQVQALQSTIQELQGQVEELKHKLGELERRGKDQYLDLDSRISRLSGGAAAAGASLPPQGNAPAPIEDIQLGSPTSSDTGNLTSDDAALTPSSSGGSASALPPPVAPTESVSTTTADPAAEQRTYDEAFAALKDGRYSESARRFQGFIDQYPNSALTGNAYYWLGESYYVTQNYRIALETFNTLLTRFPTSQKAPDALLKTGYCQYELKQWESAEKSLTDVTTQYPDTQVARLAQARLRALRLENRR